MTAAQSPQPHRPAERMHPVKGPIETKVAAASGLGAAVTLLFSLAASYHWFTPPPPGITALIVTLVSGAAGWLAPHTSRPNVSAIASPTAQLDDIAAATGISAPDLAAAFQHATAERLALMRAQVKPPVTVTPSPSGTTTGSATP